MGHQVIVVFSDQAQQHRALHTFRSIRKDGQWKGDLVWLLVGPFTPPDWITEYNIQIIHRPVLNLDFLLSLRQQYPFTNTDGREKEKLVQFSKYWVFDPIFKKWKFLLYIDAGITVYRPVQLIFDKKKEKCFIAPDDRFPYDDPNKIFSLQWDKESMPLIWKDLEFFLHKYNFTDAYFLNCVWLMDTELIRDDTIDRLLVLTRRFPISRTNEMAIMNLFFYHHWKPLSQEERLFDWTQRFQFKPQDYVMLKYPR